MKIPVNGDVQRHWDTWIQVTKERCHLNFEMEGGSLKNHIDSCLQSATATAQRVANDIDLVPRKILEVGCSTGFNCIALSRVFPDAEIHGIEPDEEAVAVGNVMVASAGIKNVHFQGGIGEHLPWGDAEFDLIVCHTVIEHVKDVERVIEEMSRVLVPNGVIHLDAPNYVWPYEGHLSIWCIPLLGKKLAKAAAVVQGKSQKANYLDHLQFVTPLRLEAAFRRNSMVWDNRVRAKLDRALGGDATQIKAYKRLSGVLPFLAKAGLGKLLVRFIMWTHLYPSVLYTIRKGRRA